MAAATPNFDASGLSALASRINTDVRGGKVSTARRTYRMECIRGKARPDPSSTFGRPGQRPNDCSRPADHSSFGRTSWAKRSITSSALSTFSGTKSSVKCSAPTSM